MEEEEMSLSFKEYSERALSTALNLDKDDLTYPVLGLAGETGEVAEKVKKVIRDKRGVFTDEDRKAIAVELSDVQWYINRMAWGLGFTLEEIAQMNLDKLADRKKRGVLSGSGDNR
jgi:NTP pyrophosphatase (non-canonical NTP hydrolase)